MNLIIAGADGSEPAERAVSFAADLAKGMNVTLLIVNVSEDGFSNKERLVLDQFHLTEGDALEEISYRILTRARALAEQGASVTIEIMSADGYPAETLISIAKGKDADALVIGRRGRSRLDGLLLGSISQKLASLAPCAVIIVP